MEGIMRFFHPFRLSRLFFLALGVLCLGQAVYAKQQFSEVVGSSCRLLKYEAGAWKPAEANEVLGKVFESKPVASRPGFSQFKVGAKFFYANQACIVKASDQADDLDSEQEAVPLTVQDKKRKNQNQKLRDFNVKINPLSLVFGVLGADVDIGIMDAITLGPNFSFVSLTSGGVTVTATGIGARLNYYTNGKRFTDSWVLGTSLMYLPISIKALDSANVEYKASTSAIAFSGVGSYQWVWNSGFNLTLGLGATYYSLSSTVRGTASNGTQVDITVPTVSGLAPLLEFSLGWVF